MEQWTPVADFVPRRESAKVGAGSIQSVSGLFLLGHAPSARLVSTKGSL